MTPTHEPTRLPSTPTNKRSLAFFPLSSSTPSQVRLFVAHLVISPEYNATHLPVILSYVLQNSIQTVSVLVAGRLGPDELSAAAFSLMLAMVLGKCLLVSLGQPLLRLTFQAGALRSAVPPHLTLSALKHSPAATVPLSLFTSSAASSSSGSSLSPSHCFGLSSNLLYFSSAKKPALAPMCRPSSASSSSALLAISASRASRSISNVKVRTPTAYVTICASYTHLGIMRMSTYVLIGVAPINLGLNVFFVHHTSLGLLGAPLAISITFWICFLLLVVLTYTSPTHRKNGTWAGFQPSAVLDVSSCMYFLKLAVPGILMVGTEWYVLSVAAASSVC